MGMNKMSHRRGGEREIREEKRAAHGKHMYYMNSASVEMHTDGGGGGGKGRVMLDWKAEARGRDVKKKRRVDPVRSAASP